MNVKKFSYKIFALLLVSAMLLPLIMDARQAALASPGWQAEAIPAPINGDTPIATVNLNPASGYITQGLTVSGETNTPAEQVRLAWIYGDGLQTLTAALVDTAGSSYSAQIGVPVDALPGPAQVCATVAGSAEAQFTCADFTITEPPPGRVTGQLPAEALKGVQSFNVTFHLFDRTGQSVYSTPVAQDGTFALDSVAAGTYSAAVEGDIAQQTYFSDVVVFPEGDAVVSMPIYLPLDFYLDGTFCAETAAKVTQVAGSPSHLNDGGIVEPQPWKYDALMPGPKPKPSSAGAYDFGLYISGVPLQVSFSSYAQTTGGAQVQRVDYYIRVGQAAPTLVGSSNTKPFTASFDVGALPQGQVTLLVVPVVEGRSLCVTEKVIQMVADPMKNPIMQPGASTEWDAISSAYYFSGMIPDVGGLLPAIYDTPSIPLFGVFQNRLSAGVLVEGFLHLDGRVAVMVMDAQALARLMNIDAVNEKVDLVPGGKNLKQWINPDQLDEVAGKIPPMKLASFKQDLTLFSGPIIAVPPWVVVRASISVGVAGDLTFTGGVFPFVPTVELAMIPSIEAWLGFGLAVDVIFGIAGAEAKIVPGIGVALPLLINPADDRLVWFDDPCLSIYVRLIIQGRFLFFTFGILDEEIVKEKIPANCNPYMPNGQWQSTAGTLSNPAVLETPALAASPDGQMLMVYVEDPGREVPSPRIMARLKAAGSDEWGTPEALTDGSTSVSDPVATFAGPSNTPMIVWTQNTLPSDTPPDTDLGEVLNHQELYASNWDASGWLTATRLTDDLVGDGRPALASDTQGATLAWTRDTDGDLSTRTDQRIAVQEWTPDPGGTGGSWEAMQLLSGSPSGGMNSQVSAARMYFFDPANGQEINSRILAWTFDEDADPNTNADRQIALATPAAGGWNAWLAGEDTARGDSPSVSLSLNSPGNATLAFLVRGLDEDGQTDTGMISNQAKLWTAQVQLGDGSVTNVMPVLTEEGAPTRAEAPKLTSTPGGETLLVFRQFGQAGSSLGLGQTSLSRLDNSTMAFSQPLMLTDEARQNWQAALAIDPLSNQASIVKIGRDPILLVGLNAGSLIAELEARSMPRFTWQGLYNPITSDDTLDVLTLLADADPALDPALALSQAHADPGSSVTVTANVRNLGRNASGDLTVNFYAGEPGSGTLIESVLVNSLDFNESAQASIQMTAGSGNQPLYASVTANGENANPDNDLSTGDLGEMPAAFALGVIDSPTYEVSLAVKWQPLDLPGIAGYRVLRSTQPGGPYELVGETTQPVFNDMPVSRGQTYYYVIQAFDENGVLSSLSNEVVGMLPLLTAFLPMLEK
jgi:YD repeat-containing protein